MLNPGRLAGNYQSFWACRCFLSESRRLISAFAARCASALVDGFFGVVFAALLSAGIMGGDWTGLIDRCSTGCTVIGPVNIGLSRDMLDNAVLPNLFESGEPVGSGCRPSIAQLAIP